MDGRQLLLVSVDTQGWKRGQRERVGVLAVVCCTYTLLNVTYSAVIKRSSTEHLTASLPLNLPVAISPYLSSSSSLADPFTRRTTR